LKCTKNHQLRRNISLLSFTQKQIRESSGIRVSSPFAHLTQGSLSACPATYIIYSDDLDLWINEFEVVGLRDPRPRPLEAG
jgi:hypothetical protein